MRCVQPITINGKEMPCGRCPACLRNRQNEWVFRLNEEMKISPYSYFFTLTYRDDDLPVEMCDVPLKIEIPTLSKRDIQLFLKRLRKKGMKFKYHIVGEYGPQTLRPHYHGLLFSQKPISQDDLLSAWQHQDLLYKVMEPCYGRSAAGYVTKYLCQVPFLPDYLKELPRKFRPFTMCSNGIGLTYLECHSDIVSKKVGQLEDFVVMDGHKLPMPRYYRNKLFPVSQTHKTDIVRVFDYLGFDNHQLMSLKRQELQSRIEENRYKMYLKKNGFVDCDSSRVLYNEYLKSVRHDVWRKAYKNSKYNLTKNKL